VQSSHEIGIHRMEEPKEGTSSGSLVGRKKRKTSGNHRKTTSRGRQKIIAAVVEREPGRGAIESLGDFPRNTKTPPLDTDFIGPLNRGKRSEARWLGTKANWRGDPKQGNLCIDSIPAKQTATYHGRTLLSRIQVQERKVYHASGGNKEVRLKRK